MHSLVLVVGDAVRAQLHAFADYAKVEPYRVYVEGDQLTAMAEHFGLRVDDLEALAAKMPEWAGIKGEIHQGKLSYWLRDNPNAKFEWYKIGGAFSGYLHLRQPRQPSAFGRMLGRKAVERVDHALKREIVIEEVLDSPPFALLANGVWVEQGWSQDAPSDDAWRQQFAQRFHLLPDDAPLTVVDIHT
ncbi:MAG TPA: hypothetical protein VF432_18300 [Thermoanaerobaculia bacterium]